MKLLKRGFGPADSARESPSPSDGKAKRTRTRAGLRTKQNPHWLAVAATTANQ